MPSIFQNVVESPDARFLAFARHRRWSSGSYTSPSNRLTRDPKKRSIHIPTLPIVQPAPSEAHLFNDEGLRRFSVSFAQRRDRVTSLLALSSVPRSLTPQVSEADLADAVLASLAESESVGSRPQEPSVSLAHGVNRGDGGHRSPSDHCAPGDSAASEPGAPYPCLSAGRPTDPVLDRYSTTASAHRENWQQPDPLLMQDLLPPSYRSSPRPSGSPSSLANLSQPHRSPPNPTHCCDPTRLSPPRRRLPRKRDFAEMAAATVLPSSAGTHPQRPAALPLNNSPNARNAPTSHSSTLASSRPTSMARSVSASSDASMGGLGSQFSAVPTMTMGPGISEGRTRQPPEMFIIVRPPVGKQNHPLNLQIQMIIPSNPRELRREPSQDQREGSLHAVAHATLAASGAGIPNSPSIPSSPLGESRPPSRPTTPSDDRPLSAPLGDGLRRSGSVRSHKSTGSVGTTGTGVSGASDGTGRSTRKTQPLWNLQWHTVLPTWISDAGTDAKIARFGKRGIEINDLAHIEPAEIRLGHQYGVDAHSVVSRDSAMSTSPAQSIPAASVKSGVEEKGPAAFFNKLKKFGGFKKAANSVTNAVNNVSSGASAAVANSPTAFEFPRSRDEGDLPATNAAMASVGPARGSGRRALGYAWSVKRWTRPVEGQVELSTNYGPGSIVVEWKRGKRVVKSRAARGRPSTSAGSAGAGSNEDGPRPSDDIEAMGLSRGKSLDVSRAGVQAALLNPGSARPVQARSADGHVDLDQGEESDAEDSERPWTCDLVLPPNSLPNSASSASGAHLSVSQAAPPSTPRPRRIHLGLVRPCPHHPRLIAQLLIPFLLGPVNVSGDTWLMPEELKDIVAVTCLWLCVKEGLGGLGQRRKGDGSWRIGKKG